MKLVGTWTVHDVEGARDLFILDNPAGPHLFYCELDDGRKIVPADKLVFDMSSSPCFLWIIYPPHFGKKAATIHDWLTRAHKQTDEELYAELFYWFESLGWDFYQRMEYIKWLKSLTRAECDYIYYVLTEYDVLGPKRRWIAWKMLRAGGWVSWFWKKKTDRTKLYRDTVEDEKRK